MIYSNLYPENNNYTFKNIFRYLCNKFVNSMNLLLHKYYQIIKL